MKTSLLSLLLVFAASVACGETKCYTVEHSDYNEAVCIGDEKTIVEKAEVSQPRAKVAEAAEPVPSAPKVHGMPAAERGPAKMLPISNTSSAVQAPSASTGSPAKETAAEHLARRKALAQKNKARISGAADTATPKL